MSWLALLTNKYLWAALGVALAVWFAYDWAYNRGVASQSETIEDLQGQRDQFLRERNAERQTNANAATAHAEALRQLRQEYGQIEDGLKLKVNQAQAELEEARKRNTKTEIVKYVTAKADSRGLITDGFVWLHNRAAGATDPASTGLPVGGPANADADSRVATSEVALTVTGNYSTCRQAKAVAEYWQAWYPRNKAAFEAAKATAATYQVVAP